MVVIITSLTDPRPIHRPQDTRRMHHEFICPTLPKRGSLDREGQVVAEGDAVCAHPPCPFSSTPTADARAVPLANRRACISPRARALVRRRTCPVCWALVRSNNERGNTAVLPRAPPRAFLCSPPRQWYSLTYLSVRDGVTLLRRKTHRLSGKFFPAMIT